MSNNKRESDIEGFVVDLAQSLTYDESPRTDQEIARELREVGLDQEQFARVMERFSRACLDTEMFLENASLQVSHELAVRDWTDGSGMEDVQALDPRTLVAELAEKWGVRRSAYELDSDESVEIGQAAWLPAAQIVVVAQIHRLLETDQLEAEWHDNDLRPMAERCGLGMEQAVVVLEIASQVLCDLLEMPRDIVVDNIIYRVEKRSTKNTFLVMRPSMSVAEPR